MAATIVPSVMVNLKALNNDNYEHWSFWMKNYLLAEDLWDVVEDTNEPPKVEDGEAEFKAWRKKNAKALHAIHISCGYDAESSIFGCETAKEAWDTLELEFKIPENLEEVDSDDDVSDLSDGDAAVPVFGNETYGPFFDNVRARRWEDVKEYIRQHPAAVRAILIEEINVAVMQVGVTALNYAVSKEDVEGVKDLLPFLKETDLEILGGALSMALQIESDSEVMTEIIKCIVEKNKKLLVRSFAYLNEGMDGFQNFLISAE